MVKRSRAERAKRAEEREATTRISAAWQASVEPAKAKDFARQVAEAEARGPYQHPPDMAPGTKPNPPRPGHEPKPPKVQQTRRRRY
jgi:hypothetical protein